MFTPTGLIVAGLKRRFLFLFLFFCSGEMKIGSAGFTGKINASGGKKESTLKLPFTGKKKQFLVAAVESDCFDTL